MTTTTELDALIARIQRHGGRVTVTFNPAGKREGRRLYETITVRGLKGIGECAMSPIAAAEAMKAYLARNLLVREVPPDRWGRGRLQNIENGRVYTDVSCGDVRHQPAVPFNLHGDWHTTTREGEPECRLREGVWLHLVTDGRQVC